MIELTLPQLGAWLGGYLYPLFRLSGFFLVVVGIGVNANLAAASMAPTDADALAPVALIDIVGHAEVLKRAQ